MNFAIHADLPRLASNVNSSPRAKVSREPRISIEKIDKAFRLSDIATDCKVVHAQLLRKSSTTGGEVCKTLRQCDITTDLQAVLPSCYHTNLGSGKFVKRYGLELPLHFVGG